MNNKFINQQVKHKKFGVGKVIEIDDAKINIQFEDCVKADGLNDKDAFSSQFEIL